MPRRLKLSSLERDVLWTLEEAGAESIATVLNTLWPGSESRSPRSDFVREFGEALRSLHRQGFLVVAREESAPSPQYVRLAQREENQLLGRMESIGE